MNKSPHWSTQKERGTTPFLTFTSLIVRYLPIIIVRIITGIVCIYYYLTSPQQRKNIKQYQTYLKTAFPQTYIPKYFPVYQQFLSFGNAITDRFAVWQRKIRYQDLVIDDPDNIHMAMNNVKTEKGEIFICSHLGNIDISRALLDNSPHSNFKINVLVHNKHAQKFNQILKKAGAHDINIIQVTELNTQTMLMLSEKINTGEWLAIAADRIPIRGEKTTNVTFLGHTAQMPQGAWLLAHLLKAKTNLLFITKINGRYRLSLRKFQDIPQYPRTKRTQHIQTTCQQYADILAQFAAESPLQWYNFYNFWQDDR